MTGKLDGKGGLIVEKLVTLKLPLEVPLTRILTSLRTYAGVRTGKLAEVAEGNVIVPVVFVRVGVNESAAVDGVTYRA